MEDEDTAGEAEEMEAEEAVVKPFVLQDSDEPLGLLAELWIHPNELPGSSDELTEDPDEMLCQFDGYVREAIDVDE